MNRSARTRHRLLAILVLGTTVAACGGPGTESPRFEYRASSATTNSVDTTTTSVPLVAPSDIPALTDCPLQDIRQDTGEIFRDVIRCAGEWAAGVPQRYVDTWNDNTDNEAEWLLAHVGTEWKVVGVCHAYYPLVAGGPCSDPYGDDPVDSRLFPPMNVQCALWDGASVGEFVAQTGCPARF